VPIPGLRLDQVFVDDAREDERLEGDALIDRVFAFANEAERLRGLLAGPFQADLRIGAETKARTLAAQREPQHPGAPEFAAALCGRWPDE
jgi:hypothetical protein